MTAAEPRRSRPRWSVARRVCWAAVGLLLAARCHLLADRLYDPDEFEHLHAALCVARGLVPYRDFFEHHGPLTYLVAAPVAYACGPVAGLLTLQRILSFVLTIGTLGLVWDITRKLYNDRAAACALVGLLTLPMFAEKSVEWRPDVPAMCLVTIAGWLLMRPGVAATRVGGAAGAILALGTLCTLKVLPVAAGMILGAIWSASRMGRPLARALAAGAVGFLIVWVLAVAAFALGGAADDFLRCAVLYPFTWPADVPDPAARPLEHFLGIKDWSPMHLGLGALGLVGGIVRLPLASGSRRGEPVAFLGAALHCASLAAMPTVYLQYYLLAAPMLAAVSAGIAVGLWDSIRPRLAAAAAPAFWRFVPLGASIAVWSLGMVLHAPALRQAAARGSPVHPYLLVDFLSLALCIVGLAVVVFRPHVGRGLFWSAVAVVALGRIALPHAYWSGAAQRADLATIDRLVRADEPVLDGFTGLGCLRPHALYWWWINQHSLRLMDRVGAIGEVERAIAAGAAALVILDEHLRNLSPPVHNALAARYRMVPVRLRSSAAVLFVRDDHPASIP